MSRFHISIIAAAMLAALALALGSGILLCAVVGALFVLVGLGVVWPRHERFLIESNGVVQTPQLDDSKEPS